LQEKLVDVLTKATERNASAETECADGRTRQPKERLDQVGRQLIKYGHRLRARSARRKIAEEIRESFALAADAIRADEKTLRGALVCPDDAL
jgi:hypothetical protein